MAAFPKPLEVERVVNEAELASAIRAVFRILNPEGKPGGITIGLPGRPRALIYVGPCPEGTDEVIRFLAKPSRFNVSPVRDPATLIQYETATAEDSRGY